LITAVQDVYLILSVNTRKELRTISKQLASLGRTDTPFISLYLDTTHDDEMDEDRIRVFLKNSLSRAKETRETKEDRDKLEREMNAVEQYLTSELPAEAQGLALFADRTQGIFRPFPLPVPITDRFIVSDRPYIRPLVQTLDENKRALAVHLRSNMAEIYQISMGTIKPSETIESEVPPKIDRGGWSQMRFQRHVEAHIREHLSDVADHLTKLFDSTGIRYVYLFGPSEVISEFIDKLPKRLKQTTKKQSDHGPDVDEKALKTLVLESLEKQERAEEQEKISRLIETAVGGGKAVLGIDDTIEALNRGAVQELVISNAYSAHGWECLRCGIYGTDIRDTCPEGDHSVISVEHLGNALVAQAIRDGGDVEEIIDQESFDRQGGIGAILRYTY